jgi:hypothetical protein
MTVDRQHGKIVWACDGATCGETVERDQDIGFEAGWTQAKSEGWKARKIAGEWLHFCAGCTP